MVRFLLYYVCKYFFDIFFVDFWIRILLCIRIHITRLLELHVTLTNCNSSVSSRLTPLSPATRSTRWAVTVQTGEHS